MNQDEARKIYENILSGNKISEDAPQVDQKKLAQQASVMANQIANLMKANPTAAGAIHSAAAAVLSDANAIAQKSAALLANQKAQQAQQQAQQSNNQQQS